MFTDKYDNAMRTNHLSISSPKDSTRKHPCCFCEDEIVVSVATFLLTHWKQAGQTSGRDLAGNMQGVGEGVAALNLQVV